MKPVYINTWKSLMFIIGDLLAINRRLFPEGMFMITEKLTTDVWRLVGNRGATGRLLVGNKKLWWDCLQPLRLIGDNSPTSRGSTRSFLPNRPSDFLATSATRPRPVCDLPATNHLLTVVSVKRPSVQILLVWPPCPLWFFSEPFSCGYPT